MCFFSLQFFGENQFQPVLWELCGGIFAERNVSEKSFHIICRQIALTRQELEEKLQSSGVYSGTSRATESDTEQSCACTGSSKETSSDREKETSEAQWKHPKNDLSASGSI